MAAPHILAIEHESDAHVGRLGVTLRGLGAEVTAVGPGANAQIPDSLDGIDGLIVMGGRPGPYDDESAPWLPTVKRLIGEALDSEIPLLGVCLGAQLLSVVAGGRVETARQPEIGIHDVHISDDALEDPLLGPLAGETVQAMQWHFLEIVELPPGIDPLAESDLCINQAFRVGPNAWGLQFHLEAGVDQAIDWAKLGERNPDLLGAGPGGSDLDAAQIVRNMHDHEEYLLGVWPDVTTRWFDVVTGAHAQEQTSGKSG